MASTIPYTYFQCPCTSETPPQPGRQTNDDPNPVDIDEADEEERTFDPRAPRANFSLYPLDHLLYCEDCQQIRCPRCVLDEIVTWYCPNCLFEVPSSTVKTDGNRCTRSCFQCPSCTSPLSVSSLETLPTGSLLGSDQAAQLGPWVLNCSYCAWSSHEIGIKFDKPNGIYNQLAKIKNGGETVVPARERRLQLDEAQARSSIAALTINNDEEEDDGGPGTTQKKADMHDHDTRFANLRAFYQSQLAETTSGSGLSFTGDYGYGSPGALSRIMGLYTGTNFGDKKSKSKNNIMREAQTESEGLVLTDFAHDRAVIEKLCKEGWESTTSAEQRYNQLAHTPKPPRFVSDMRPVPYLLRTKRSKRCRACRHILSKPEAKVQTTRFRIRLVAMNYIPHVTIKPLNAIPQAAALLGAAGPQPQIQPPLLQPLKPTQFLLTLRNPLFDPIKITLATPSHTPGRFASKVTILCPQFDVGANTDVWDEALGDSTSGGGSKSGDRRKGMSDTTAQGAQGGGSGQQAAEAGKVWERGRNWSTVVVEVVPASLDTCVEKNLKALKGGDQSGQAGQFGEQGQVEGDVLKDDQRILEDEDILEIPVFVRVEWETDAAGDEAGGPGREKSSSGTGEASMLKDKRELAYWCVLGVGRIARG